MTNNDYYDILGIQKNASEEDIKKNYKLMAKQWHPDMHGGNDEAKQKFQKISEAYEVLSDPEKKKIYDQYGEDGLKETNGMSHMMDPMKLFAQMMGQMGLQRENDVPDSVNHIKLTLEQLYTGDTIEEEIERHSLCDKCNGKGSESGEDISCKKCKGQGVTMKAMAPGMFTQTQCKDCKGSCIDKSAKKCSKCTGIKFYKETVSLSVDVPKGAYMKYPIILENEGNQIPPEDIQNGDMQRSRAVFVVVEEPHDVFKRGIVIPEKQKIDYADLMVELVIPFADSIKGFKKNITHLDGKILTIEHDEPCRYGDILVVVGNGMPVLNSKNKFGDLFIKLNVEHPKDLELSKETREHIFKKMVKDQKTPKPKQVDEYKTPTEWISFDEYKLNAKINAKSNSMKEQYKKRGKEKQQSDTSDDDDNFGLPKGFPGGGMPQCQQQ